MSTTVTIFYLLDFSSATGFFIFLMVVRGRFPKQRTSDAGISRKNNEKS
jgi:hypothetical protein